MIFKQAIKSGFSNFANFKGRATRSEFWYWVLFFWISAVIGAILDSTLFPGLAKGEKVGLGNLFLPMNLIGLVLLIPNISVFVRRLHDSDHKGWWWLIVFLPFGGLILFIWLCSGGTKGTNKFGENLQNDTTDLAP